MTDLALDDLEEQPERSFLALFGPGVAVILGVSIWVQVAAFTLRGDVAISGISRALAVGLPLVALVVGVFGRSSITLLAFFPMTLVPPLLLSPDGATASFGDPWSAGRVCASFALYCGLVSAWLGGIDGPSEQPAAPVARGFATDVRRFVYPRVLPLLLWWAVPTYALFWDPAIVGTIAQSHGEAARVAQVFGSVAIFFTWAVAAYMWFIVPSLNIEYDRRQVVRDARALVAVEPRVVVRRILVTVVGIGIVTLALVAVI